jgi:hypothetical protein
MNIKELNKKNVPIVKIDKALNSFDNVVLFPDKLKKANKQLSQKGLPKSSKD